MFKNRKEAGLRLAAEIKRLKPENAVVLCIPRGGAVVGAEVAEALGAPLDLIVPRKIGAPVNPEMAVGAVAQDGSTFMDDRMVSLMGIGRGALQDIIDREVGEISRRMADYRGSDRYPDFKNNTLVIVDDGAATGYTMLAAARFAKRSLNPAGIIIAVPVAPPDTLDLFRQEAGEVVCLAAPGEFYAVGQFYSDFSQTSDSEVLTILKKHRPPGPAV
ncbi:MAG: phosphoribosyltransferase [Bacillota bacterium]